MWGSPIHDSLSGWVGGGKGKSELLVGGQPIGPMQCGHNSQAWTIYYYWLTERGTFFLEQGLHLMAMEENKEEASINKKRAFFLPFQNVA